MIILEFGVGVAVGLLSGFGIGGGTLLILWLTLVSGMDQLRAGGINLLYFSAPAITALVSHIKNRLVEKKVAIFCILSGIPCCILGSMLANNINVSLLRRVFGALLLFIGFREVFFKEKKHINSKENTK